MKKALLIDGHSLAMRSHYGVINQDGGLLSKDGIPVNVCVGFLTTLARIVELRQPTAIAIAFDSPGKTYRHQIYPEYKAGRQEKPHGFEMDLGNLQRILTQAGFTVVRMSGWEADDIIATLSMHYLLNEHFVEILTSDKDFYQLIDIDDLVVVIKPDGEVINSDAVFNQLGVKTYQFLDYKILVGDKSDNIPGIKGIGEKTAVKLLQEYGAIAKIYENLENLKPSIKTKLESGFNQLGLLTELVAMRTDIPVDRSIVYNLTGINFQECQDNLLELNLRKEFELLSRIFPSPVWTTPPC